MTKNGEEVDDIPKIKKYFDEQRSNVLIGPDGERVKIFILGE